MDYYHYNCCEFKLTTATATFQRPFKPTAAGWFINGHSELLTIIQSDLLEAQRSQVRLGVFWLLLDAQHLSWAGEQRVLWRVSRGHKGSSGTQRWRGFPLRSAGGGGRRDGEGLKGQRRGLGRHRGDLSRHYGGVRKH